MFFTGTENGATGCKPLRRGKAAGFNGFVYFQRLQKFLGEIGLKKGIPARKRHAAAGIAEKVFVP